MKLGTTLLVMTLIGCGSEYRDNKKKNDPPPAQPQPPNTEQPTPPNGNQLTYSSVAPIIEASCSPCHFGNSPQSGFGLDSESLLKQNLPKAVRRMQQGSMPPPSSGKPRVSNKDQTTLVRWYSQEKGS